MAVSFIGSSPLESTPMPPAPRTLADLVFHVRDGHAARADLLAIKRLGAVERWSTARFLDQIHAAALALEARGLRRGDRLAIYAENCPEWHAVDFACQLLGVVSVPLYPTLPAAQVAAILRDAQAAAVVYSDADKRAVVSEAHGGGRPALLVAIDDDARAESAGASTWRELVAQGEALGAGRTLDALAGRVAPEDLASLIYTSGTGGDPKGVELSHRAFVENFLAAAAVFPLGPGDLALSFLPLSHVFERTADHLFFYRGVPIHYVPVVERVPPALLDVKPTVLPSVPRLYERAYLKIQGQLAKEKPAKRRLFAWALAVGKRALARREAGRGVGPVLGVQEAVASRLVFAKVRQRFGGRLRFAISGGAPLPRQVGEFFTAMGVTIYQGYGLTETAPVLTANHPAAHRLGSVGRALPGVQIEIAGDGEILAKTPALMRGYWRKPEATAEAIDGRGWFHTGDIGRLDADGFLFITDRKKDLLVTSGGKNVAPQPLEEALVSTGVVAQAVAVGDRYPYVTALLVPNFELLAAEFGGDPAALAGDPRLEARLQAAVETVNGRLAEHERIRRFRVLPRELTIAAGELTPTLKLRRRAIGERYADTIASMYLKSQRLDGE
jgi:long-chain acyl-CoA synthetase